MWLKSCTDLHFIRGSHVISFSLKMRLSVFEILCFMITYCCCVVRVEIIRNNPEEHVLELSVNRAQFSQLRNKVLLSRLRRDTEPQDPSKVNVGGKKDCVDVSALADQDQKGIGVFDVGSPFVTTITSDFDTGSFQTITKLRADISLFSCSGSLQMRPSLAYRSAGLESETERLRWVLCYGI